MPAEAQTELDKWKQAAADSLTTIKWLEARGNKKSARIRELETELTKRDDHPKTARPYFSHLHLHTWTDQYGEITHGIAVRKGRQFAAHLTAGEAIALANRLADLVERMEQHDVEN